MTPFKCNKFAVRRKYSLRIGSGRKRSDFQSSVLPWSLFERFPWLLGLVVIPLDALLRFSCTRRGLGIVSDRWISRLHAALSAWLACNRSMISPLTRIRALLIRGPVRMEELLAVHWKRMMHGKNKMECWEKNEVKSGYWIGKKLIMTLMNVREEREKRRRGRKKNEIEKVWFVELYIDLEASRALVVRRRSSWSATRQQTEQCSHKHNFVQYLF